ncbi:exodeoxyribonuclease V subunit beta [Massilia sp. TS11]|uniref:exodeoxyribonuclease V subunit beta n=1 Tax=Massilia sp. TS11 TaxID=2908003 RepID=UPI001EDB9BD7|nr:exodeoxyribonuclease V subunit beta [Massilia sp. TS11]MCG2584016.1 exodeoxyribonuclease V subunit beta [Massilia sp. TS11]
MSQPLHAIDFPLHGSRLIEASAGTGKTWTIAALYLRLVLGHGGQQGFARALRPGEILVMTFTRAATRELSDRVRARLVQAAAVFRGGAPADDPFLAALLADYQGEAQRLQAAHILATAAEAMDDAAVFTIDAWCQRMLREHAFDSGSLFDEELVSDESALFDDAAHDYWRQQVYPLAGRTLDVLRRVWPHVEAMKDAVRPLLSQRELLPAQADTLADTIALADATAQATLAALKRGWDSLALDMRDWMDARRAEKLIDGAKLQARYVNGWCEKLQAWAADPELVEPDLSDTAWKRLSEDGLRECLKPGFSGSLPPWVAAAEALRAGLDALSPIAHTLLRHAAVHIGERMDALKQRAGQFGFADMLVRLRRALEGPNGAALRQRIVDQYPVALVDEFQDTSPEQYRLFDLLYRIEDNLPELGIFLIGDPKQSIYAFRGADIQLYLRSRRATRGRHYQLGTNYRSTSGIVEAVNRLFGGAEERPGEGAFRFRRGGENELPFEPVAAAGRSEVLETGEGPLPPLDVACLAVDGLQADPERDCLAAHCAERIVALLNDSRAGLRDQDGWRPLQAADIAVLVRGRKEAELVRRALLARGVKSVYLSDKDSIFSQQEAQDMLRWLRAVANPLDNDLARAAFASASCALSLGELAQLVDDELQWEARLEQLKALHLVWQRQGVLAMLRRFIHELALSARLLARPDGERRLTNLLHLAEMLQQASIQLDGELALVRWLSEQIAAAGQGGDEAVLRLESDAALVKVVTVHKSKGLEYPLVFLPFAHAARKADKRRTPFVLVPDANGRRQLDLMRGRAAMQQADEDRLAEDLRLMYVALTRARHYLWLGMGPRGVGDSAMAWLLTGSDAALSGAALLATWQAWGGARVQPLDEQVGHTWLTRGEALPPLTEASSYNAQFERDWQVGSFSALVRQLVAPPSEARAAVLFDDDTANGEGQGEAPWHRFPRGAVPGNFLHEQLEWMAQEGFASADDEDFATRLTQRCERAGWGNRAEDACAWLKRVASTRLPPLEASLGDIGSALPEMEFWFPSERLRAAELDAVCRRHLLDGIARPPLPERQLHGMLKGYADLVFEHDGRYWVLDYKSNALGTQDAHYPREALAAAMAEHRYDVQAAIYMLALHRLLQSRLGASYDPAQQLGGAVFLFLRGIAHPQTHGCYWIAPDLALLDALDALMEGRA